jgi:hypothetical protein
MNAIVSQPLFRNPPPLDTIYTLRVVKDLSLLVVRLYRGGLLMRQPMAMTISARTSQMVDWFLLVREAGSTVWLEDEREQEV